MIDDFYYYSVNSGLKKGEAKYCWFMHFYQHYYLYSY